MKLTVRRRCEAASKLKQVLSAEEQRELDDGGEISMDDLLAAKMAGRVNDAGITFVAFTATPKAKTLDLFGRRPDPSKRPGKETYQSRSMSIRCGRRSKRDSFWMSCKITLRTSWFQTSQRAARSLTTSRSSVQRP